MIYTLHLGFGALPDPDCSGVEDQYEAIEFAIRTDTSENGRWIPLRLSFHSNYSQPVPPEIVRGYTVPVYGYTMDVVQEVILICGEALETSEIQFRWMGSAHGDMNPLHSFRSDIWALTSVYAYLQGENGSVTLIEESFGRSTLK